jgi:general secretion pathway protein G
MPNLFLRNRGHALRKRTVNTSDAGFTLIELLIVIVIMGLLMSLVAPTMFSKVDSAKVKTAEAQMDMLATALDTYRLDLGTYPAALEELRRSEQAGWDGPYLPKDVPLDPWGSAYLYDRPGENGAPYRLLSLGSDGQEGGDDDGADIVYQ